jgi:hypothetical protein
MPRRPIFALALLAALFCCTAWSVPAQAGDGTGAQQRAAEEYLAVLSSGDPKAVALSIHQDELEQLRKRLVDEMKLEADRNDSLVRTRLFGAGMPLVDIERLTPQNFFATLAARLRMGTREFERIDWLAAVDDSGGMVQMVGRGKPAKDHGNVRVPVLVSIVPWGKDWKAALPLELQAQIDDLRTGRVRLPNVVAPPATAAVASTGAATGATGTAAPKPETSASPQAILELFRAAEENLQAARCEEYYDKQMSPNFRRTTSAKALRALITSCQNRESLRQQLTTALQLARNVMPRFEYAGTRAVYDLRGNGLPYASLVLEQVDKRWYIAE